MDSPITELSFRARILRKQSDLPRYIVISSEHSAGWTGAFEALVSLNGYPPFKRNIRPWSKGSDVFFFNLTQRQCEGAGLDTNDECSVAVTPLPQGD